MDQDCVLAPFFMLELADGLEERLALDIADRSADFNNRDLRVLGGRIAVEPAFALVCEMRDDLYSASAEVPAAFLLQNRPVDFSGRDIRIFCQAFVDKSLIVSQVEVSLGSVVCDEDLPVLYGVHCPRIDIDIGIELLHCDRVAARFQKTSQGSGGDAFPETGNYAACNKYILYCHFSPPAADIF